MDGNEFYSQESYGSEYAPGAGYQPSEQVQDAAASAQKKPQFNLKANKKFVGNGWMGDGKFGKFISFIVREPLAAGTKVYLSPRKGCEGILG